MCARSPAMEIVTQQLGEALEVKVKGRLDNYWTEHLRGNLEVAFNAAQAAGLQPAALEQYLTPG